MAIPTEHKCVEQVHKASLHYGRHVAEKSQYLGLEAAVAAERTTP